MPGSGSMKMPNTSSSTLTANRNASGDRLHADDPCGQLLRHARDRQHSTRTPPDIATMISTDAVISAERGEDARQHRATRASDRSTRPGEQRVEHRDDAAPRSA